MEFFGFWRWGFSAVSTPILMDNGSFESNRRDPKYAHCSTDFKTLTFSEHFSRNAIDILIFGFKHACLTENRIFENTCYYFTTGELHLFGPNIFCLPLLAPRGKAHGQPRGCRLPNQLWPLAAQRRFLVYPNECVKRVRRRTFRKAWRPAS